MESTPRNRADAGLARPGDVLAGSDDAGALRGAPDLDTERLGRWIRARADLVAVAAITAVAAGIRFLALGVQGLDHDEAVTAVGVMQPTFGGMISAVVDLERTPPLYYMLEWLWTRPLDFGTGVVDLRLLSAAFGTLTVPVAYLAARELSSRKAGVAAAALVALNPFCVWYSQEARSYALLILLVTLGLYLFARVLREPAHRRLWAWALVSVLALCTHYFAAFTVAPEAIWLLVAVKPRRRLLAPLAFVAAAGGALLPLALAQQSSGDTDWFSATPILTRVWQIPVHYATSVKPEIPSSAGWITVVQISTAVAVAVLCGIAVAILVRRGLRTERRGAAIAAALAAASFVIPVALAAAGADFVDARNLAGSLALLLVAAAIAFGAMRAGRAGAVAGLGVCASFAAVLALAAVTPQMQRPDWSVGESVLGRARVKRIAVVPRPAGPPLAYYLGASRAPADGRPVWTREIELYATSPTTDPPERSFALASERAARGGMWIARYISPHPVRVWLSPDRITHMIGQGASAIVTTPTRPG